MCDRAIKINMHVVSDLNVVRQYASCSDDNSAANPYAGCEDGIWMDHTAKINTHEVSTLDEMKAFFRRTDSADSFNIRPMFTQPIKASQDRLLVYVVAGLSEAGIYDKSYHPKDRFYKIDCIENIENFSAKSTGSNNDDVLHQHSLARTSKGLIFLGA